MLRIQGTPRTLCDGWTRRDWLHLGGLGAMGLTLEGFWRHSAAAAPAVTPKSFGGARVPAFFCFPMARRRSTRP